MVQSKIITEKISLNWRKWLWIKLTKEEYHAYLQRLLHCVYIQADTWIWVVNWFFSVHTASIFFHGWHTQTFLKQTQVVDKASGDARESFLISFFQIEY